MISLSIADGVAEVVLNAPQKLNSLDEQALAELSRAYDDAAAAASRGEVRALLLRGEGRAFCAGRDIAGVTPETDDAEAYLGGLVQPLLQKMSAFPAPTFAAAQGACLGVGLGLLLATDVVYVAENAKFGSPFAKLGATLDSGGHWYFTERLGMHRTLDLIYTAELISGAEAVAQGMFSRALPSDGLLDSTRAIVAKVATGATGAFKASKELVGAHPRPAPGPLGLHAGGECRAGVALQDRGLRRGLPRVPGEARATVHRPQRASSSVSLVGQLRDLQPPFWLRDLYVPPRPTRRGKHQASLLPQGNDQSSSGTRNGSKTNPVSRRDTALSPTGTATNQSTGRNRSIPAGPQIG
jgi:enoyl-CoA hydratase/carnithine racemase